MERKIRLRPGWPDNDNRDYLPDSLKDSDIVVNENGNNSQPYPERLKEYRQVLADGVEDIWYEYVPECYDPEKKTPLVFSMHGGLMTGWGQAVYTSWTMVAEQNNVIVVFPNAHSRRLWTVEATEEERAANASEPPQLRMNYAPPSENHDMRFILKLMELMKEKYNIDAGRIFMQGMSNGNMMTSQFVRYYGHLLAGAAGSGGPYLNLRLIFDEDWKLKNPAKPLAIWQTRPERNGIPPWCEFDDLTHYKYSRLYWLEINGCVQDPQICIKGENNFAFYKGREADFVYLDVKNRDHGQTLDEAALVWDYFFSGVRRDGNGHICCGNAHEVRQGDAFAIAVTAGSAKAWFHNRKTEMDAPAIKWTKWKYHGLNGGQKSRGEYLCVPVSFLEKTFGAACTYSEGRRVADILLKDGRELQLAHGSIVCLLDGKVRSMYCETLFENDELYISLEWFARCLYGCCVSVCEDVVYVTDHHAELSRNMADLIKDILNDDPGIVNLDAIKGKGGRADGK